MVAKTVAGAEPILATITKDMPLYTLHDRTHILNVIAWMEALLGEEGVQQTSQWESALALMAAYIHDLGMTLGAKEAAALRDDTEYKRFKDGYLDLRLQIEALSQRGDSQRAEKIEEHLRVEFLRRTHASDGKCQRMRGRLKEILPYANDLEFHGLDLRERLIAIAVSHNEPAHWLRERLKHTPGVNGQAVNDYWIGILLRLADILDFDRSRTPSVLYHHLGLEDDFATDFESRSQEEWRKHLAITHIDWSPAGDRLTYEATDCWHPAVHKSILTFAGQMQREIEACHEEIRQWPQTVPPRTLRLSKVEAKITPKGYVYQDWSFELDQQEIIQLLMGESLYGNSSLCIRELLQNALDAVELRDLRLQLQEKGGKPGAAVDGLSIEPGSVKMPGKPNQPLEVRLCWGETDGRQFITVEDNGVGMTKATIARYFTRIGKSFYRSAEFRAEQEEMRRHGLLATPISQFGIGVLSCFMIADRVSVKTHAGSGQAVDLEISGPGSLFWTREGTRTEQGTEITLWLKSELRGKPVWLRHDREECWDRLRVFHGYSEGGAEEEEEPEDTDGLDPAYVAGQHVVWPKHPVQVLAREGQPWAIDDRFHVDHLAPMNEEHLRKKIAEFEYPPDCISEPHWVLRDWADPETGSRVRFWRPEDPGTKLHGATLHAWELETFVDSQVGSMPLQLVQGMHVEETGALAERLALAPGVGWRIWIDYRGTLAPGLTADRCSVKPLGAESAAEQSMWHRLADI